MSDKRLTRRAALAGGVGLAAATVASCAPPASAPGNHKSEGSSSSSSSPGTGGGGGGAAGALNAYLYQKPKQFSPLEPANGPDQIVMDLIFDSLLKVDPDGNLVPSLCTAMPEVSKDGKTLTFHLKPGQQWSDGTPFTSKDVAFTYNAMASPDGAQQAAGAYSTIEGAKAVADGKAKTVSGFQTPDDNTFVIKGTETNLGLAALIGRVSIIPEHILGKVATKALLKHPFFNNPTVGVGPYSFVTYKTDQYVELKANPKFREPAKIATVYLKPVTTDVAVAQLGTGEMDLVQISPTDMPTVQKMKNVKVASKPGFGYIQCDVNQARPYFKDPRVRQALLYGVNRKGLVDQALKGQGKVINSSFLVTDVLSQAKLNDYPYDPAKAKQLLKDAGWDPKQKVILEWIPGQADRDTAATIVQAQMSAVGMNVQLKKVQAAELLASIDNPRDYDLLLGGGGNRPPDPWTIYNVSGCDAFYPGKGGNVTHFCNSDFDKLMKQANQTVDKTQRMTLYAKAAEISNQDPAFQWLFLENVIWGYNTRISGFVPSGNFTAPFWNIQKWSLSS